MHGTPEVCASQVFELGSHRLEGNIDASFADSDPEYAADPYNLLVPAYSVRLHAARGLKSR